MGSLYMVEPFDHSYEPDWRDESQLEKVSHKNSQNHYDKKENNEWYGTELIEYRECKVLLDILQV